MSSIFQKYKDFSQGVVNAIEPSELPLNAVVKSQNFYHRDGFWRKLPGLVEINITQISADPVRGVFVFHQPVPKKIFRMAASGTSVYFLDEQADTFTQIFGNLVSGQQVEFLEYPPYLYFGSQKDLWRRFDGGTITYSVGGNNGLANDAPRKFKKIIFNPYAGRFFGIGQEENPDFLFWSNHIDKEGIEKWPDANIQIIESINGDNPQWIEIFEGLISIFSQNSISTGTVIGVPEVWSFERQKSQTGAIAGRTVKRYGDDFFMLTPSFDVYAWPRDIFITRDSSQQNKRVNFNINPYRAHLACAEIVDNRYYYLVFESGHAADSLVYEMWVYDIFSDRWFGPHLDYNIASMFYDKDTNLLLTGGSGTDLQGFVLEHRGLDIKNKISKIHWVSSYSDFGAPRIDKRYHMFYLKMKHQGTGPANTSLLTVTINVDNFYKNPQSQNLTLIDDVAPNSWIADTTSVREAITKRAHIFDRYGRGNSVQIELRHEVARGDFAFSEIDLEYFLRTKKEQRNV